LETASETSAVGSEKEAFVQLLEAARTDFPAIKVVTTDGHTGIAKYMKVHVKEIPHNLVSTFSYCLLAQLADVTSHIFIAANSLAMVFSV